MKATLGGGMGNNPVEDLHWLFETEESNEGLYTKSEAERDPSLIEPYTVQEWLGLNKRWGHKIKGGNPEKIDTWYEITWRHSPVLIEKNRKDAILKFKMLALWLEGEGWEVHKTAGRA